MREVRVDLAWMDGPRRSRTKGEQVAGARLLAADGANPAPVRGCISACSDPAAHEPVVDEHVLFHRQRRSRRRSRSPARYPSTRCLNVKSCARAGARIGSACTKPRCSSAAASAG